MFGCLHTRRKGTGGLQRTLEQHIAIGTRGQVHNLEVEVTDNNVVVRGRCRSYHAKQLVLEAVRRIVDVPIDLAVSVGR